MIENKIEQSALIQVDPVNEINRFPVLYFDIATLFGDSPFLKEKDYRINLKTFQPELGENKLIGLHCSADVILPKWAFMLTISHLKSQDIDSVVMSEKDGLEAKWNGIRGFYDFSKFYDQKIIVKGCSKFDDQLLLSDFAYHLSNKASSLMFGEACSAVPINKKRKA